MSDDGGSDGARSDEGVAVAGTPAAAAVALSEVSLLSSLHRSLSHLSSPC
jgi:hypothetical protein